MHAICSKVVSVLDFIMFIGLVAAHPSRELLPKSRLQMEFITTPGGINPKRQNSNDK
jgi:ABC-type Fe3+-siderophore transport system permease subunit